MPKKLIRSQTDGTREYATAKALDRIGDALQETGLSLDELIESGREERAGLIETYYGLRPDPYAKR